MTSLFLLVVTAHEEEVDIESRRHYFDPISCLERGEMHKRLAFTLVYLATAVHEVLIM